MKTTDKRKKRGKMIFHMIAIIFVVLLVSYFCTYILLKLLIRYGVIEIKPPRYSNKISSVNFSFLSIILMSALIGIIISIYLSKKFLKPIKELKETTKKIANGNFDVNIELSPNNEMGELVDNFNIMVKELKKNETLKNDFISNVSHEFKTPLSAIQGYVTLLQDATLSDDEREKYTNDIISSTKKLTALVNNILKITKIDNQKISIEKDTFRLDEQIRESILLYEKEWNEKNIDFDISLENVTINADKKLLENVWNNLISNAIKYSKKNDSISVILKTDEHNAIVTIKDNGIGIPEEALNYIFDKFYQVDTSHSSEGNGLGLALVKKIIDLSNGSINVKSKLDEGSEFTIYLPF